MKKQIFLFLAAALTLASCGSPDKIKMVGMEDLLMVDETRFEVTIRIENRNGNNLGIRRASLALIEDQTELIHLSLDGKVVIPRHSDSGVTFPISMRMSDPDVLAALPEKTKAGRPLTVAGSVTGQSGIFSKTYKIGPMPVDEFLNMLDEQNREMVRGFIY